MGRNDVEILAPAGSPECARAAIAAGADAIYIGGQRFGARAYAENPEEQELLELIDEVHLHGRKIYLTINTLLKNKELEELYAYLLPYYKRGIDAVIVQDIGVMRYVREHFPGLLLHVSTQATVAEARGAKFFGKLGAERIVPARELSLAEIRKMKEETGLEIECFIHGAMCYCYSGQCLLSSMIGGRSGNRGQCAQPCRLPYSVNGKKPQDILSLKDMCTIELLPELIDAGIDSFKIEGRMKQPEYVYTVTKMYRKYADLYLEKGREGYLVSTEDKRTLEEAYRRRGYIDGYYRRQNGREMISLKRPEGKKEETPVSRDYKTKEKINGTLILSEGKHVKLSMEYHGKKFACAVEVTGDEVQRALKAPLDRERIEKQMRKTGNTDFVFDKLKIQIEGNVFLPMQSLNELRREGLAALRERILKTYHREQIAYEDCSEREPAARMLADDGWATDDDVPAAEGLQLSVQTEEQFRAVRKEVEEEAGICRVYVDDEIAFSENVLKIVEHLQENSVEVYLAMPYIFRDRARICYEAVYEKLHVHYDGILIRNWESYEWLKEKGYEKSIVSDYNLYVFNRESQNLIKKTGISMYTSSPELHYKELKSLGGQGILAAYGYQPVMITANCIRRTSEGCSLEGRKGKPGDAGKERLLWITDRYQKKFAVKNDCRYCYNVMYNCAPLFLADLACEVQSLNPSGIRLDFTIEREERTREMIRLYRKAFLDHEKIETPDMEYTRGHFKRGVK